MPDPLGPVSLSVVVPNHDRSATLLRAVLSVLRQARGAEVEIVVVDDGSTADLSRAYGWLAERGVRIVRLDARRGGSRARNAGVEAATKAHVSFLDSDDVWLPGRLDRIAAHAAGLGNRALLSGVMLLHHWDEVVTFDQPPWPEGGSPADFIYRDGGRLQTSMLTLPLAVARAHRFREDLRVNQDSDYAIRLHEAGVGFVLDPVPGVIKDECDRADRLSLDPELADLSLAWFRGVSGRWSPAAVRGYHLRDRVWRLANSGRRAEALAALARANLPPLAPLGSLRMGAEVVLGRGPYLRARDAFRARFPKSAGAGGRASGAAMAARPRRRGAGGRPRGHRGATDGDPGGPDAPRAPEPLPPPPAVRA